MIPVSVVKVSISNVGFVVLLEEKEGDRTLPIFIGVPEAQAIAIQLKNVTPPRPLTHDLMKNLLEMLEARVEHVEIHSLVEGTFYGRLVLAYEGETLKVDSRASDAVALALRCHVPILVATAVMDEAGVTSVAATAEAHRENPATEDDEDTLPSDPVARLEALLQRAVEAEEYEEAARIRDEIKNQRSHN